MCIGYNVYYSFKRFTCIYTVLIQVCFLWKLNILCEPYRTEESDEVVRNALKDSGSDSGVDSDTHRTTNDSSLDKAYWIHRAAEVCCNMSVCLYMWCLTFFYSCQCNYNNLVLTGQIKYVNYQVNWKKQLHYINENYIFKM